MAAPRARRSTAIHEAAHAVAHHFLPLAGRTTRVTIDPDDLAEHNAAKVQHPINEAAGLHSPSRVIRPIVGRSVDREQLRHVLLCLLAGRAAGWVFAGESSREAKRDRQAEEDLKHADGGDDYSRALNLLFDADPFDSRAAAKSVPDHERATLPEQELHRRYVQPAVNAHTEKILAEFEALWREALELAAAKWPHIQAVADALWRKRPRRLSGDEVTEIIEGVEDRLRRLPPSLAKQLESLRKEDSHSEEVRDGTR